jgi:calreticulin
VAKKIENPEYKGEWSPKQIKNKDFEAGVQLAAFDAKYIGYELWIVNNGTIFDNILVTDDIEYAKAQGEKLWRPTSKGEKEVKEKWDKENKPEGEDSDDGEDGEGEDGEDGEGDEEEEKDEL